MLVLTRKKAETVRIGDEIIVKVIQTGRGSIKIGIDAPPHVRVMRGEVAEEEAAITRPPRPTKPKRPFVGPGTPSDPARVEAV